jgi:hypothetical protein
MILQRFLYTSSFDVGNTGVKRRLTYGFGLNILGLDMDRTLGNWLGRA